MSGNILEKSLFFHLRPRPNHYRLRAFCGLSKEQPHSSHL